VPSVRAPCQKTLRVGRLRFQRSCAAASSRTGDSAMAGLDRVERGRLVGFVADVLAAGVFC
jgi:hypothetical protein